MGRSSAGASSTAAMVAMETRLQTGRREARGTETGERDKGTESTLTSEEGGTQRGK